MNEMMKLRDVPCGICGVKPECDISDGGPYVVYCPKCGSETNSWAYKIEAFREWKYMNTVDAADMVGAV